MEKPELHPIFERLISRTQKEQLHQQRARVIWLYGLSGSGKSTLAAALEHRLFAEGFATTLLDGDNVRTGLNRDLGFSDADRTENIRRIAETARLFMQAGIVTLCSFITPLRAQRTTARHIIGSEDFVEVYVKASYAACAKRDPKGLYARADAGGVKQFSGHDSAFEEPADDERALLIDTEHEPMETSMERLYAAVIPALRFK